MVCNLVSIYAVYSITLLLVGIKEITRCSYHVDHFDLIFTTSNYARFTYFFDHNIVIFSIRLNRGNDDVNAYFISNCCEKLHVKDVTFIDIQGMDN